MARCRTCEAPIEWATTPAGKTMPLDAAPTASGTWCYSRGETWLATEEDRALKRPLYTSHFATCPDAAQHRTPRGRRKA